MLRRALVTVCDVDLGMRCVYMRACVCVCAGGDIQCSWSNQSWEFQANVVGPKFNFEHFRGDSKRVS